MSVKRFFSDVHVATADVLRTYRVKRRNPINGGLRCGLCGEEVKLGEKYRHVYANGTKENPRPHRRGNFVACVRCLVAHDWNDERMLATRLDLEGLADKVERCGLVATSWDFD